MIDILNKLKGVFDGCETELVGNLRRMKNDIDGLILAHEIGEKVGLKIEEPIYGHFIDLYKANNAILLKFGDDTRCEITWEDDGRKPVDGWYLKLCFSNGPYHLNSGYPVKSFTEFFNELNAFGADYCDTRNCSLYFNIDTNSDAAKRVLAEYGAIYKKYYDLGRKEVLAEKITKAEAELLKLKQSGERGNKS